MLKFTSKFLLPFLFRKSCELLHLLRLMKKKTKQKSIFTKLKLNLEAIHHYKVFLVHFLLLESFSRREKNWIDEEEAEKDPQKLLNVLRISTLLSLVKKSPFVSYNRKNGKSWEKSQMAQRFCAKISSSVEQSKVISSSSFI